MKNKNLVLSSLVSALIILSILVFKIPTAFNNGYIHIGDVFIYLGASILPTKYAMLSAIIGSGLSDILSGGVIWLIPTIIIKGTISLLFTSNNKKIVNSRNIFSVFIAAIIGVLGYYLYGAFLTKDFIAPLITLPMEILQPLLSGIIYIILGKFLDKINFKSKI